MEDCVCWNAGLREVVTSDEDHEPGWTTEPQHSSRARSIRLTGTSYRLTVLTLRPRISSSSDGKEESLYLETTQLEMLLRYGIRLAV